MAWDEDFWSKWRHPGTGANLDAVMGFFPKVTHTSESHPIEVDWVPSWALGSKGRLGMTFAPGKRNKKGTHGEHLRSMAKDLDRLTKKYGTGMLVTLMEEAELRENEMSGLFDELTARGVKPCWLPIRDLSFPVSVKHTARTVAAILAALHDGVNVVVHCRGGHGRTGLLVACVLTAVGHEVADAIKITRAARKGTIHNAAQEDFIALFKTWLDEE